LQNAKHGNNSFRIRLAYTHGDASQKLHSLLPNEHSRKRKTGFIILALIFGHTTLLYLRWMMDHIVHPSEDFCDVFTDSRNGGDTSNGAHKRNSADGNNKQTSESDSFIYKTLEGIQDQDFCNVFQLPPEKVTILLP